MSAVRARVTWFAGRDTVVAFLRDQVLGSAGTWRALPTRANGEPAFVTYQRQPDGGYRRHGVHVVTLDGRQVTRFTVFLDESIVHLFGFPDALPA